VTVPTLDTNLLLRLVLGDVPGQYQVVRDMVTAPGARYRVTDLAIVEIVHALVHHYGMSRPATAQIVRAIIADTSSECHRRLIETVLDVFVGHPSLSFVDCFLAEEAQASGNVPLLTFDKRLARQHVAAELVAVLQT
jgi:predicted nucleic-acid-binding protein